jgi:putative ABC transport system ATP-binding protein
MDATTTTAALRVEGLKSALAGPFDLEITPGACVGITGASGSGKSLFLRMICDLDPNAAPAWRRRVIYVPAESGWWSEHIFDHFAKDQRAEAGALCTRLGLPDAILDQPVSRLSTGERQRLALIRAFVAHSPVLLLDEPTSALDGDGAGRIERMAAGMALVLVTHDPAQADRLAGRRYVMAAGRLGDKP